MFSKKIEKFADVLIEKEIRKEEDRDFIIYGLSIAIEIMFNIITTICLGILFGHIIESIIFLISFSFLRTYAGGYHCEKALNCYLFSSGIVLFVLFVVKFMAMEYILPATIILLLISIPIILKLAPVETPSKPLDEDEKKHYGKKVKLHLVIEIILIIILFFLKFLSFSFTITLGVTVSGLLVLIGKKQTKNVTEST